MIDLPLPLPLIISLWVIMGIVFSTLNVKRRWRACKNHKIAPSDSCGYASHSCNASKTQLEIWNKHLEGTMGQSLGVFFLWPLLFPFAVVAACALSVYYVWKRALPEEARQNM